MSTSLAAALRAPMSSVDDVLSRMRQLDTVLSPPDGVACFNRLYRAVTEQVSAALVTSTFEDPAFLERLDLVFAARYFSAVADDLDGRAPSRSWRVLFDARHRRTISPLRFAIAGMNAHINFDLALSLVETCRERAVTPEIDGPQQRDFVRVNTLLANTMPVVKRWFATGVIGVIDDQLGEADDLVALFSIVRARDAAWHHAQMLWLVRDERLLAANYVSTLDRTVGLFGASLLCPRV